jgi:hypothetical protein
VAIDLCVHVSGATSNGTETKLTFAGGVACVVATSGVATLCN